LSETNQDSALEAALKLCFGLFKWAFFLCLLAFFLSGVHVVPEGKVAQVQRLGRWLNELEPPGLHFAWPSFIDNIVMFDLQQQTELELNDFSPLSDDQQASTDRALLTAAGQLIHSAWTITYRLHKPKLILKTFGVHNREHIQSTLSSLLKACLIRQAASVSIEQLLMQQGFAQRVQGELQYRLAKLQCGIVLENLNLDSISVPARTKAIFEQVSNNILNQDNRRQQAISEAQQKKQKSWTARKEILGEVKTQAQTVRSRWQADADNLKKILDKFSPSTLDTWLELQQQSAISEALDLNQDQTFLIQPGGELRLQLSRDPNIERLRREERDKNKKEMPR
jgi:regulator of protease activity HflC (stomatin/prohibitin superfamily)